MVLGNAHCYGLGSRGRHWCWWNRRLTSRTRGTVFTQLQALKEETLRAACLVVLMTTITGVSKLGLRVRWIAVATGVVSCNCDAWIDGPSCAFIVQARSKVTVSY